MSWDIHIQDFPEVNSIADIPDDFEPSSLGSREALIAKIKDAFPSADFKDPSWGLIDGDEWSIEVNIGPNTECGGIMLHVRGGDGAVAAVEAILDRLGLRAIDLQTGEFFDAQSASDSFGVWRGFRDQVVADYAEPKASQKQRGFFGNLFAKKNH